jgi:hypothetical protein
MKGSSRAVRLVIMAMLLLGCRLGTTQPRGVAKSDSSQSVQSLERGFFTAIREGDAQEVLSYISARGVNVGRDARHASRDEVEQQFATHSGLYCKLFDSACIQAPINLESSARVCSYRELLTRSKSVRKAASEVTRNGVQQAVLVAQVSSDECPNQKLIDIIFNLEASGWKLFSIP